MRILLLFFQAENRIPTQKGQRMNRDYYLQLAKQGLSINAVR